MSDNLNLLKAIKLYKISICLLLFSLISVVFVKPAFENYEWLIDALIGLPFLLIFIISPIGIFFIWKSKRNKEPNDLKKLKYFLGHLIFVIIMLVFFAVILSDIRLLH